MEMNVVNILSVVLLIGFHKSYTAVTDTDREEIQQEPFTSSENTETERNHAEYSDSYKQAIKQLENYIQKESDNLVLENEEQAKHNQRQYIDGANKKTKKPFVMSGPSFGKRQHDLDRKRFMDDSSSQFYKADDKLLVQNQNNDDNESIEGNKRSFVMHHIGGRSFIHSNKRPFTFSFGKRFYNEDSDTKNNRAFVIQEDFGPENIEEQSHFTVDDSLEYHNDGQPTLYGDITVERKRPFVFSTGNHFGRAYKFGKRGFRDITLEGKRPFVFSTGNQFGSAYKFGKRGFRDITVEGKRPFVFSTGNHFGSAYKFGKRGFRHITVEGKRPFVFSTGNQFGSGYKFGKRSFGDITVERKRPFVFSTGNHFGRAYKFGKRSFNEVIMNDNDFQPEKGEIVDPYKNKQENVNLSDKIENLQRVEKRPFVMFGGYDTRKKSAGNVQSYQRIIGSGFRFGKRQHWNKLDTSLDTQAEKPHITNFPESDDTENGSVLSLDNMYMVEKRPFVIGGIYHRHDQIPMHNLWKLPMIVGSGFRFGKRQYDNTGSRISELNQNLRRLSVMNLNKRREHGFREMPDGFEKRFFTFRNDYHFGKLKDSYNEPVGKRPIYLESFGKKRDQSEVSENIAGHSDNDRLEFNGPGEVSTGSSVGLTYNTVKRPFVLGSGRGYKFGK